MSLLVVITVAPCSSVADKKRGPRKEVPFRITTTQTPDQSPFELDDSGDFCTKYFAIFSRRAASEVLDRANRIRILHPRKCLLICLSFLC